MPTRHTRRRRRSSSGEKHLDRLPLRNPEDDGFQVVVETPRGSQNKYAFDPKAGLFRLKKVLPTGMTFPYDFGFLPSTKAEDGDPVDVLVLMDQAAFPGCVVSCRLIGAITGEQREKKHKPERNDRLVGVETCNHSYAAIQRISDLGRRFLKELEEFFVNYHELSSQTYQIIDIVGPKKARKLAMSHVQ